MRFMIGIHLAALAVALLQWQVAANQEQLLLRKLCTKDANLTSIAQLRGLIETVERAADDQIECSEQVKHSILDLKPIVGVESVCSPESFERIAEYYDLHVHEKYLKLRQSREVRRVPPGVKRFFIAYGLQVSKLCRLALVQNLAAASSETNIEQDDVNFVTGWIDDEDPNYRAMIGEEARLENLLLLLLGELAGRRSSRQSSGQRRKKPKDWDRRVTAASVPAEAKAKIDQLKARCAQKFKPIYAQLIVPLVRLSYLGFNYRDRELADKFSQFEQSAEYKNWFKIVFVCESIMNMRVVSIKDDTVAARFLTEENLEQLEREQRLELAELAALVPKPTDYKPIVRIDAEANLLEDEQMLKSVKSYNPKSSQSVKLLTRIVKNVSSLLNSDVKERKIRFGLEDVSGERLGKGADKFGRSNGGQKSNKISRHIKKALKIAGTIIRKAPIYLIVAIILPFRLFYLFIKETIVNFRDLFSNGRYSKQKYDKYKDM